MNSPILEHAVRSWCEAAGMKSWNVEDDLIASVDETPVCVHVRNDQHLPVMHVLCALGAVERHGLPLRLLRLNFDADMPGCFALGGESGDVFFRIDIPMTADADGIDVPAYVKQTVAMANAILLQT